MENPTTEPKQLIDLETIPKLITAIYFMAAAYAVVKLHLHYEFFLHVSIFQYLDITEILLFAASTGVTWLIYLGGIILGGYILNDPSTKFNVFQKIIFGSFVYGCVIGYMYLAYQFDPIIKQTISLSWSLKWWTLLPLTLIIIAWIYPDVNGPVFFKNNKIVLVIFIALWYAAYESYANFQVIRSTKSLSTVILKKKSGCKIVTNNILVLAGRTKNYWFLYNRLTHFTRAVKNDDIELIDFKAGD